MGLLQLLALLGMTAEVTCVALLDFTAVVEDRKEAQILPDRLYNKLSHKLLARVKNRACDLD